MLVGNSGKIAQFRKNGVLQKVLLENLITSHMAVGWIAFR